GGYPLRFQHLLELLPLHPPRPTEEVAGDKPDAELPGFIESHCQAAKLGIGSDAQPCGRGLWRFALGSGRWLDLRDVISKSSEPGGSSRQLSISRQASREL